LRKLLFITHYLRWPEIPVQNVYLFKLSAADSHDDIRPIRVKHCDSCMPKTSVAIANFRDVILIVSIGISTVWQHCVVYTVVLDRSIEIR